jgi:hypothetical protein
MDERYQAINDVAPGLGPTGLKRVGRWQDSLGLSTEEFVAQKTELQFRSVGRDPKYDEVQQSPNYLQDQPTPEAEARYPWEELRPSTLAVSKTGTAFLTHEGKLYIKEDISRMSKELLLQLAEEEGVKSGSAHDMATQLYAAMQREEQNYARHE